MPKRITDLILPVGTQVVTRVELRGPDGEFVCLRGAVGVVLAALADNARPYRVRLVQGSEVELYRRDLSIRKHCCTCTGCS